jgi:hypothetical protein
MDQDLRKILKTNRRKRAKMVLVRLISGRTRYGTVRMSKIKEQLERMKVTYLSPGVGPIILQMIGTYSPINETHIPTSIMYLIRSNRQIYSIQLGGLDQYSI